MPCFKGLAVSIHTPDGPLPEFSIQRQARASRISSYIPVPDPKFQPGVVEPEQSTFAISITLLVPHQKIPYSGHENSSFGEARYVSSLPTPSFERGRYTGAILPYQPLTSSVKETVAAYIHFDGRAKEEVATLLRRGEETWVNSRWVSVPDSEGGGLAEREFLFREVGLERWLNGLDLTGGSKEVAAKIERRKQRLEKKLRRREEARAKRDEEDAKIKKEDADDMDDLDEKPSITDAWSDTDSDSDEDDVPMLEAAGQIKVTLFRVLASGEVKKGEYSPQFNSHDDDENMESGNNNSGDLDGVDHTTTFAKPKALDPKTISTQTVTGIDGPDKPFATFTFFYRGKSQLRKMGILTDSAPTVQNGVEEKPKSRKIDFDKLGPLKAKGAAAFSGYRDPTSRAPKGATKTSDDDEDDDMSDGNDAARPASRKEPEKTEDKDGDEKVTLSAEEIKKRNEMAEGVKNIHLKRQRSIESSVNGASSTQKSTSSQQTSTTSDATPRTSNEGAISDLSADTLDAPSAFPPAVPPSSPTNPSDIAGSPFKKPRPSVSNVNGSVPSASPLAAFQSLNATTMDDNNAHPSALSGMSQDINPGIGAGMGTSKTSAEVGLKPSPFGNTPTSQASDTATDAKTGHDEEL